MKLSIITINYNNVTGLRATLESIGNQTFKGYELVIVDGGSQDGSKEVIEHYARIHSDAIWVSESDKGIYNAMNKGVRMASGDFCIFMNSGDCFYAKDSLLQSMPYLNGQYEIISGVMMSERFRKTPPTVSDLSLSFFVKDCISHQSTFICRHLLIDFPYNESRNIVGDHEFFFQVLILGNATYLDIPICISYCEAAGVSGDLDKSFTERITALKELLPQRMTYDVDFIWKYHNPIVISCGNLLYKRWLRKIFFKYNQLRKLLTK